MSLQIIFILLFTGYIRNGLANGKGRKIFKNGDYYDGEFSEGIINGQGSFTYFDGLIISGHFENGYLEGQGRIHNNIPLS
jgi:hypothetical protein